MDINNTLFQTLLHKQNITEFRAFRIEPSSIGNSKLENNIKVDYRYVNLNNIYAYIKNDIFHICNDKFEDIKISDIHFPEKGLHRIGYNDDEYFYPITDKVNSVVVNSDGRIVFRNPREFFYVGSNEFLESCPTFINDYENGILYDFIKRKFIRPKSYNFLTGYEQDYSLSTPEIGSINLFVNGCKDDSLLYLFSLKKNYINPPHIASFFTCDENKSVVYFESSKYGTNKKELNPVCLWYTNNHVYAITIKLLNEFDNEDNIVRSDDLYPPSISFEINIDSGSTFNCNSNAILEFNGRLETKYDLEYFYKNLEFIPTKNSLLILFSDDYRYNHHTIIINDKGEITLCKLLECSSVSLTENNILRVVNYGSDSADYCDIFGTRLCTADKHSQNYHVFTRNLREPSTFNYEEIIAKRLDHQGHFYEDGIYSQFEGVIDLQSGKIIVPPCYSKIQLKELTYGYKAHLETPTYISIVQIDNFFNGVKDSYFGIYQNNKITTPLAYTNIQYIKYKYPKAKVYDIRDLDDDHSFKESESIFLLLERNGLYGVASMFGNPIIEPCAESYKILEETRRVPIKNEYNKVYLHHIPYYGPEYIALCRGGAYNLIYQDHSISDFNIDDFELISLDGYGDELFFIKTFCDLKEALVYNGNFLTKYFHEVTVYRSKFGNTNEDENNDFVIVLTDDLGRSSLINCESQTIIDFGDYHIIPYLNFVKVDSQILDINNNLIFNAEHYILIDEKKGCNNEHILCFHNNNIPDEYIVINNNGDVIRINIDDDSDDIEFYVGYNSYYFDSDLLRFEEVPEIAEDNDDEYDYVDYPDDTDYERDTFYALGGDDYDEWKNNGGNIDDMMDGMGF